MNLLIFIHNFISEVGDDQWVLRRVDLRELLKLSGTMVLRGWFLGYEPDGKVALLRLCWGA